MNQKFILPDALKTKLDSETTKEYEAFGQSVLDSTVKSISDNFNTEIINVLKSGNTDVTCALKKVLDEQQKELGLSAEQMKKFSDLIDEHSVKLKAIAENGGGNLNAAKSLEPFQQVIMNNFKGMKEAYSQDKANRVKEGGYTLLDMKAVDEHDPARIVTTANLITGTGINWLGGSYSESNNVFRVRRPIEFIRSIINITTVSEVPRVHFWDEEGDETGAFAIVEENEVKPQVGLSLVRFMTEAQKVAGYIVATEEVTKFFPNLWAQLQLLFRSKLERDYNRALNNELITNAVAYPGSPLDGTIANPTDIQAIAAAALAVQSLNFTPDTIVLNPTDWWRILLSQANNGTFVFLPFIDGGSEPRLFGFRLITSNYVPAGTFYIGESGTWYVQEETPIVRTGWVNDDFIHNRMTIVGELFFLSWIPSVFDGSWIAGNFEDIKDALQQ